MFEITGKYGTAKVYATTLEDECISQIYGFMNSPVVEGCNIAIMPDAHCGKGSSIGFTQKINGRVNPNMVGVDISCFTKDTKIALADGRNLSFEELINEHDKEHYGYSIDKNGSVQISKLEFPRKIKTADKLLEIELDNGEKIKCTLDHIFYKRDCSEVEAKDLKVGDSLYPLYIKPAKDVFENSDDEHLCIFDGKNSKYVLIHKLSDDYNERHGLGVHFNGRGYVRHHKDFNKFNNDPTNIQRVLWEDHRKIHAANMSLTNKLGITGFAATERKHPGSAKRASIKRAEATWNGPNAEENRKKAAKRLAERGCSEKCRAAASKRQKEHNTSKFSEHNKEEWMKNRQKLGRIRKVLLWLQNNSLEINEKTYNEARKNFYNYKFYKDAKQLVESLGLSFEKILKGETVTNHKIVSIKEIEGDDVYCLTCQEFGNFALASGVFVHNCGMLVAKLDGKKVNELFGHIEGLKRLDKVWRQKIPMGCNHRNKLHKFAANCHLDKIKCPVNRDKLLYSIGTLGGGNHFCELDKDDEGNYYIVIHSGSRHLGVEIAKYYEKKAKEYQTTCSKEKSDLIAKLKAEGREKEIQSELAKLSTTDPTPGRLPYLEGDLLEEYLNDMKYAQEFAMWNREAMLEDILDEFKLKKAVIEKFCTLHNYIDIENGILRKGAISLQKDELAIIPGSMEFGSLVVRGKGNPEWNFSGPHGFGRKLSRSKAKETLSMEEFKSRMKGIYTTSVSVATIDESPMAYKDPDEIISNITDTCDIVTRILPVWNVKAGDED